MNTAVALPTPSLAGYYWPAVRAGVWEFFVFGLKEARACIFAGSFFVLLLLSKHLPLFGLARYDFLCLAALALQVVLLLTGIESRDEALTLGAFHIIGLALEIFKTQPAIGSWSYPEAGYLKVAGVPLYSGFMYAAVASYMCQAWRLLRFDLVGYPSYWLSVPLSVAIYLNFFTHHFFIDLRWLLLAGVLLVFRRSWLRFTVIEQERSLPLVLTFFLVGFFIWVAENISTYFGAWVYPEQRAGWQIVSFGKISSWTLLVIISGMIVADLKQFREKKSTRSPSVHG